MSFIIRTCPHAKSKPAQSIYTLPLPKFLFLSHKFMYASLPSDDRDHKDGKIAATRMNSAVLERVQAQ